jgi:hypothetical protein
MYLFKLICGFLNDAISSSGYIVSNGKMNDELERLQKELVLTKFEEISPHIPGGNGKMLKALHRTTNSRPRLEPGHLEY